MPGKRWGAQVMAACTNEVNAKASGSGAGSTSRGRKSAGRGRFSKIVERAGDGVGTVRSGTGCMQASKQAGRQRRRTNKSVVFGESFQKVGVAGGTCMRLVARTATQGSRLKQGGTGVGATQQVGDGRPGSSRQGSARTVLRPRRGRLPFPIWNPHVQNMPGASGLGPHTHRQRLEERLQLLHRLCGKLAAGGPRLFRHAPPPIAAGGPRAHERWLDRKPGIHTCDPSRTMHSTLTAADVRRHNSSNAAFKQCRLQATPPSAAPSQGRGAASSPTPLDPQPHLWYASMAAECSK